jgi:hypothetical protein
VTRHPGSGIPVQSEAVRRVDRAVRGAYGPWQRKLRAESAAIIEMQEKSGRIRWAIAVIVSSLVMVVSTTAGGQAQSVPPPAVDSPNVCVLGTGSRSWCGDDGPADRAKLAAPSDVAVAQDGSLLVADTVNNVIRRVRPNGTIVSIGGTGADGSAGVRVGAADAVGFDAPRGVAAAGDGGVLVADTGHDAIRLISAKGTVTALVGRSGEIRADLKSPGDVTALGSAGYLIADTGNHRVLRVTEAASNQYNVDVLAGSGQAGYSGDGGPATAARLSEPTQVFASPDGSVLVADTGNGAVRRILPSGVIETVVRDLDRPEGVLGLADGGVIVSGPDGLYRVEPDGSRAKIAGGPERGYNGDRGPALELLFDGVGQIASAPDGRVLFTERGSDRIRAFDPAGTVDTVAGSGSPIPDPKAGISVGAFPPGLSPSEPASRTRRGAALSLAQAAQVSQCEFYDSRFAIFTFKPMTETVLTVTRRRRRGGLGQISMRFSSSVPARVVILVSQQGASVPVGATRPVLVRASRRAQRISVRGRFEKRTYAARLYGVSLFGVRRCDAKFVRVR